METFSRINYSPKYSYAVILPSRSVQFEQKILKFVDETVPLNGFTLH
jgi:hypothetical protein